MLEFIPRQAEPANETAKYLNFSFRINDSEDVIYAIAEFPQSKRLQAALCGN